MNKLTIRKVMTLQATAIILNLISIIVNLSMPELILREIAFTVNGFFVVLNGWFLIANLFRLRKGE